jgi:GGDEF domain-containing protein
VDEAAMARAAALLRRALRPGDLPFRLDNDHLAVVLLRTGAEEAAAAAARVTSALNADATEGRRLVVRTVVATAGEGAGLSDLIEAAVAPFPLGAASLDFLAAVS